MESMSNNRKASTDKTQYWKVPDGFDLNVGQ